MKKIILSIAVLFCLAISAKAQYTTSNYITGLTDPIAFAFLPDGRIILTLKDGQIKIYNANGTAIGTFYDLSDSTYNNFERGLLGIDVDPDFATNHYIYAYYNHLAPSASTTTQELRVMRFTENNNVGTNPTIILKLAPGYTLAGNHVGGNLHFRPSEPNKLYVSIGELAVQNNAQLLTNPYGKFLRINKDGSIPTDNPFYDDGNPALGNDDRIWSYGHRNAFDFCFSPLNDSLYSSENGANTWDEVNIVTRGKNYGWKTCEGDYVQGSTTTPCTTPGFTAPIETWATPLPSVTGIVFYTGCLMPALTNHLLVADNNNGRIYDCVLGNAPAYDVVTSRTQLLDLNELTALQQGPDGAIYALNGGYTPNNTGKLYKITPTVMPTPPVADIITGIVPYEACVGVPFTVDAAEGNGIITYDFTLTNGNQTYSVASPSSTGSITALVAGAYDLQLIVSNGCQSDTDFVAGYITVFDPPVYTIETEDAIINGVLGSAWLTNYSNVGIIVWLDSNNQPITANDTVNNLQPGTYYLLLNNGDVSTACSIRDTLIINLSTGLPENTIQPVKTYPNPANDRLFIDLKNITSQALTAQVYNATGALVMSQTVNGKALAELNIAALPNGIYYLLINGESQRYSAKWVKQ